MNNFVPSGTKKFYNKPKMNKFHRSLLILDDCFSIINYLLKYVFGGDDRLSGVA